MFKRVDKRRRKKEEEEKLGLDEEVKEILGIQDTDSEESESGSDSDEEGSGAGEEMNGENGDEDEDEDEDEGEGESITVSEALKDPVYVVSIDPDVKACIVCPGKLLKSIKMVQLHRTSNAHIRRFKQFSDASADANSNDTAWEILKRNSEIKPKLSLTIVTGASKRAEKKRASQARRKARRTEAKEKARAKKLKTTFESPPESASPPKKKRKVDQVLSSTKISTTPTSAAAAKMSKKKESVIGSAADYNDDTPHIQGSVKIQDIVKSTSNRAKTARSRALNMSKNTSRLTKSAVA